MTVDFVSAQALSRLPDGLNPGDQFRYVFVTAGVRNATSSAIADYDSFVSDEAERDGSLLTGLGLTYQVIGSTETVDAIDHIVSQGGGGVPLVLVTGEIVVDNVGAAFDGGGFETNLDVNQFGIGNIAAEVFTGSDVNGMENFQGIGALGTTDDSGFGALISLSETTQREAFGPANNRDVSTNLQFYAISSVVTAVPEPGSLVVVALAVSGLVSRRRRYCVLQC